jgi:cysteine desulfurase family protein (TIGR01976 family)
MAIATPAPQPAGAFDSTFARAQFAGLDGRCVFLDNAGGSLVLERVIDDVADYLRNCPVQLGASYPASAEAARRMVEARGALGLLLGAGEPLRGDELVLGASSTALLRNLAEAMRDRLVPGDEVVVTDADHEANITPWLRLERFGVTVRTWRLNPDSLELEIADLAPLMGPRTRLVCFTQASNVLGTLHRAAEIVRFVHEVGAEACVDGVTVAPHRLPDVRCLGADYYVLSLYKCFGPHLGLLYGRHDRLAALGNINHLDVGESRLPWKLEPGAYAYELAWGARRITDYLAALGARHGAAADLRARLARAFAAIARHEQTLGARLLDYLRGKASVTIVGRPVADEARRLPIVSFVARGLDPAAIVAHVDRYDLGIRHGHFHALRLIRALGLAPQGVVRVSLAHYNTAGDVDRLIEVLERIL